MYVINQSKGIGKVIEVTETNVTVYFEETDETKTLIKSFVKIYETLESAEIALNPEISEVEVAELLAELEDDKKHSIEAHKQAQWLENHNIETSKKLMENI